MSTFYDDASLALIPSGIKDGKVYSIKPTDGSGDFTFSRGTSATRVNSSGLIEKERGNLLTYSNDFSQWSVISTSINDGQTGYDGSSDAWILEATSAGSGRRVQKTISVSGVQTYSFYAKAGTANWSVIGSTNFAQYFDLQNGLVGSSSGAVTDATIEAVGSGWYRCTMTTNESSTTFQIYVATADNNTSVSIGDNIYIQDAQLEQGLVATDYIETGASPVYEGITDNLPRLDYSGGASCPALLLEPQRTNLFEHSEYFQTSHWSKTNIGLTTNDSESAEGVDNASLIYPAANSSGLTYIYNATTGSSGRYTISAFVKADGLDVCWLYIQSVASQGLVYFDLSDESIQAVAGSSSTPTGTITNIGNDWYRITCTLGEDLAISSAVGIGIADAKGSTSVTKNGEDGILVYGLQIEAGSYATSYIPTYGASASRAGDKYYNNNLASIHDTSNGFVLMFDYSEVEEGDSAFQDYFSLQQAFNNDTGFRAESAGTSNSEWRLYTDNITTSLGFPMTISNIASRRKVLLKVESTGISLFADGALITSQSGSVTIPTLGTLQPSRATSQPASTGIKQSLGMIYFSPLLTDDKCIALTQL